MTRVSRLCEVTKKNIVTPGSEVHVVNLGAVVPDKKRNNPPRGCR